MSLMIQPADLINIDPHKNKKQYLKNISVLFEKSKAIVNPQRHGQNRSIKPIGFFTLVSSIK
tara:strand:- start:46 stop:231 length:186 start_codon:yes stop_codon:yes gene_type:complete